MLPRHKPPGQSPGERSPTARLVILSLSLLLGVCAHSLLWPKGCGHAVELQAPVAAAAATHAVTQAAAPAQTAATAAPVEQQKGEAASPSSAVSSTPSEVPSAEKGKAQASEGCPGGKGAASTAKDFVFAVASMCNRTSLMKGHRAWTKGMRSLIMVECEEGEIKALNEEGKAHNEVYAFHRNVDATEVATTQVSAGLGSLRAAMAPTMAHLHFGDDYKWLLYGDDDTMFMMPALLDHLKDLDPELPWLISDNAGWAGPFFARCIPCTFNDTGLDLKLALAYKTCNCDTATAVPEIARLYGPFKRRPPWIRYGGPGQIASVGLMRKLNHDTFKACAARRNANCGGGDCTFSNCIDEQGYTYTDLGWSIRHRRDFPHRQRNQFGLLERPELDRYLAATEAGTCDGVCRAELRGMASVHFQVKEFLPDRLPDAVAWLKDTAAKYGEFAADALGLPELAPAGSAAAGGKPC